MSERDLELVKLAFETDEWNDVSKLEKQAESDEAKIILKNRAVDLYHREEAFAGLL